MICLYVNLGDPLIPKKPLSLIGKHSGVNFFVTLSDLKVKVCFLGEAQLQRKFLWEKE